MNFTSQEIEQVLTNYESEINQTPMTAARRTAKLDVVVEIRIRFRNLVSKKEAK